MEQAPETIMALHWTGRHPDLAGRCTGSALPEPLVRPSLVVMLDELTQHALQVLATEDQQVVGVRAKRAAAVTGCGAGNGRYHDEGTKG